MPRATKSWFGTRSSSGSLRSILLLLGAGVIVGALGVTSSCYDRVAALEEQIGLRALFWLRGARPAPDDAIIVTMTRDSSHVISLPNDPRKFHRCIDMHVGDVPRDYQSLPALPARWPRCVHARLLSALTRAGADTVIIDVLFRPRPPSMGPAGGKDEDEVLAEAIQSARKVILAQKLEVQHAIPVPQPEESETEALVDLSEKVEHAALGTAPMLLPKTSNRAFNRFYAFKSGGWHGPAMPVVALQSYALEALPDLLQLLSIMVPAQTEGLREDAQAIQNARQLQVLCLLLRRVFSEQPGLAAKLQEELRGADWADLAPHRRRQLQALIEVYGGEDIRYFNFFGLPGAIKKIRFDEFLDPARRTPQTDLRGKVVFVGFSEVGQSEQLDHYPTVMSEDSRSEFSGVELGATAFLNLLDNSTLKKANRSVELALVFLFGLGLVVAMRFLPLPWAGLCALLMCAGYMLLVTWRFSADGVWLPLVTPLGICMPLAVINALSMHVYDMRAQSATAYSILSQFIPVHLVRQFVENVGHIDTANQTLHSVCVSTDAKQYTSISESMEPDALVRFMNHYFGELFQPVANHGGMVLDTAGDSMVAVFPARNPQSDVRAQACVACLEILDAIDRFNLASKTGQLPTRIGVDFGAITLAKMGTANYYGYRAVGDRVNTASRLQDLNKHLGTRLLVSDRVISNLDGFVARDLGNFLLRGKHIPVHIYELIGTEASATDQHKTLCVKFSAAMADLNYGDHRSAAKAFREIIAEVPGDGPSMFYLERIRNGESFPNDGIQVGEASAP